MDSMAPMAHMTPMNPIMSIFLVRSFRIDSMNASKHIDNPIMSIFLVMSFRIDSMNASKHNDLRCHPTTSP